MTKFPGSPPEPHHITAFNSRQARIAAIKGGDYPTLDDLCRGYPFMSGERLADMGTHIATARRKLMLDVRENDAIDNADYGSIDDMQAVAEILSKRAHDRRMDIYLATMGSERHRGIVSTWMIDGRDMPAESDGDQFLMLEWTATGIGILESGANTMEMAFLLGMSELGYVHEDYARFKAVEYLSTGPARERVVRDVVAAEQAFDDLFDEDRAEVTVALETPAHTHVVVQPFPPASGSRDRKTLRESYKPIAGKALPLITRPALGAARKQLLARRPHMADAVDVLLGDMTSREVIRLRPTILVGDSGVGKTLFAKEICAVVGLPWMVFAAGGVSDGTFAGTAAQWSSSGSSTPLQHVLATGVANGCVIIDEIDKPGVGRQNGNLHDALLNFLDRGNAASVRDPSLEVTVDLSAMNWILTANDIDGIPTPLRDRCRIIRVPKPEWKHVGDIVKAIIDDISEERELDRRWIEPLAPDELELIRKSWTGSVRQLHAIVETLIDGRHNFMPRA